MDDLCPHAEKVMRKRFSVLHTQIIFDLYLPIFDFSFVVLNFDLCTLNLNPSFR